MVQYPLLFSGIQGRSNDAVGIYYSNLHDRKTQLCLLAFPKESKSGGDHYRHKMVEGKAKKGTVSINKWRVRRRITYLENDGTSACSRNSPGPCPILSFHPSIPQMFHKGLMLHLVPGFKNLSRPTGSFSVQFQQVSLGGERDNDILIITFNQQRFPLPEHPLHRRHLNPYNNPAPFYSWKALTG